MMEAMVVSALESAKAAERYGLAPRQIILSAKVSGVRDLIDVYTNLAARCDYALHLGLDRSGHGREGADCVHGWPCAAAAGGHWRHDSRELTPKPGGDRTEEVQAAQQILQSLSIRSFMPQVTSCPGCGRTTSTYFQELAEQIQSYLRTSMPEWRKKYPGVEELKLAVMGCVVNGPGESKHANLGISLPGTFEEPSRAGLYRWQARNHAARRLDCGGVQGDSRQVCREPLRAGREAIVSLRQDRGDVGDLDRYRATDVNIRGMAEPVRGRAGNGPEPRAAVLRRAAEVQAQPTAPARASGRCGTSGGERSGIAPPRRSPGLYELARPGAAFGAIG
jgi:hypothetical protein